MGRITRWILGPEHDYTDPKRAAEIRKELADLDIKQKQLNDWASPSDWSTLGRDNAAYDRKRADLLDDLDWATCSGKYKR